MSSRRLDISSLLCSDDVPPHSQPIPDPVVLAPHLRNPNSLAVRPPNPPLHRPTLVFPTARDVSRRRASPSPPRRYQADPFTPAQHPAHSPTAYAPPSPASPYTRTAHDLPQRSPPFRRSSSPLTLFQSPQLPSPYPLPSPSSYPYQVPHLQPSNSRVQQVPHSRSTSNPINSLSGSPPTPGPTSASSPQSSSRSSVSQKANVTLSNLDALVHVASQESRRLSASSSSSLQDKHSNLSPIVNSPLYKAFHTPPLPPPSPNQWQFQHHPDDKWQKVSPVSDQLSNWSSTSPAHLPRVHGISGDNLSSVVEHSRHKTTQDIHPLHQQRPFSDAPMTDDSSQFNFEGPLHSSRPSRFLHTGLQAREPVSPNFDDRARRTLASPTSHSLPQPLRFTPVPPPISPEHRHQLPPMDLLVLASDQDTNRRQLASRVPLPVREFAGGEFSGSPVSNLSASTHAHHFHQPNPLQCGPEVIAARQNILSEREVIPLRAQRRRVNSSPGDSSEDRPRKRQRSATFAAEAERVDVNDVTPRSAMMSFCPPPEVNAFQSGPSRLSPKNDEPVTTVFTGEHGNRRRSKSRIADLLNTDQPAEETFKALQPSFTAQLTAPAGMKLESGAPRDNNKPIESVGGDEHTHPRVTIQKLSTRKQDAHEWLLELCDDSPAPDTAVATPRLPDDLLHPASPSLTTPLPQRIKTSDPEADVDIDIVTEFVVETLEVAHSRPTTASMDVEEELLSLVGDTPVVPHTSRHLPSATSPLSQQHPPPAQRLSGPASDNLGTVKFDSKRASPAVAAISAPSPSSHESPAVDVQSSDTLSVHTHSVERGSMPPPAHIGGSKKGDLSGAKRKEKTGKSVPKAKPPPRPRAKPVPKTKSKATSDGPSSGLAAKGAKGATLAITAVPPAVKKSISANASRSRSTSVMPRGSTGPDGDSKADIDELAVGEDDLSIEDDKLYCVCKTKYDEDRVMIACDRCDEWYHTQCVQMPDLEIDLVDQFVCPLCIAKHPDLSLKTTYKTRCLYGLKHADPSSAIACHKPARGVFSKYCSDECGRKFMQCRIDAWEKGGGNRNKLWESVKNAEKREGIVICTKRTDDDARTSANVERIGVNVKPKKTKAEQAIEMLNIELDRVVHQREQIKKEREVALWRRRLLDLASARAENADLCGWDQRLCFGDEEWMEFEAGVWDSYGAEGGQDSLEIDGTLIDEGAWWCAGKKVCERHAGWQSLREKDVSREIRVRDEALQKLTSQEREIRKRIEDTGVSANGGNHRSQTTVKDAALNGDQNKKSKKKPQ